MTTVRPAAARLRSIAYVALAGCAGIDSTVSDPSAGPRVEPALAPSAVVQKLPDPPITPAEAAATCGPCGRLCGSEQRCVDAVCAPRSDGVARLLAPQSFGRLTSPRPMFRWVLPAHVEGAQFQLCHDRACDEVLQTVDLAAQSLQLPQPLAAGVYFWRVRARRGTFLSTKPTPVWEFAVGVRGAEVDTVLGRVTDFNGDGYADLTLHPGPGPVFGVYLGNPQGLDLAPVVRITPPPNATFNTVGDLDGDGFVDALSIVTPDGGDPRQRTVRRYRGGPGGLSLDPAELALPAGVDHWPDTVTGAGDLDGDGYADLLAIDQQRDDQPATVRVFLGAAEGLQLAAGIVVSGESGDRLGATSSGNGDVNGDGRPDLLLGSPSSSTGVGRALVGLSQAGACLGYTFTALWGDPAAGSLFGEAVSVIGDFNGDGYGDPLVAEPYDRTVTGHSRAVAFRGGPEGVSTAPAHTMPFSGAPIESIRLQAGGDFNGDGYGDAVLWTHNEDRGPSMHLFYGSPAGLPSAASRVIYPSDLASPSTALSFVWAGDADRDGYDDLLLGLDPTQWLLLRGGAAGLQVVDGPRLELP